MSLFVKIKDILYHIPSIVSITIARTKILKRPVIIISYHRGKPDRIYYSKTTDEIQKHYLQLINSFNTYNEQIKSIPLFTNSNTLSK
jgi:hypothetical protein